ncbi:MAG: GAF domain-containing protein, partial [Planctomycetota bacterium]
PTVVGRSSVCDIKLKDLDASRRHAEIIISADGKLFIRDLASKNGTFINEKRITEARVQEQDIIRIGNTLCTIVSSSGSEKAPPLSIPEISPQMAVQATHGRVPTVQEPSSKTRKPKGSGWEQLEGGATLMNLKREDLGKFGLSGFSRKTAPPMIGRDDSTVHTMIDLKKSTTLFKEKELEDIEQLKKAHKYLCILYEVANTLGSNLDLDIVLNDMMKTVFRVLHPDRGFILLYDEDKDELHPKVYLTREGTATSSQITYSRSIIQKAIETDSAILCSDASSDERFSGMQSIINYNIRSAMCVPLKHKGKLLGVLQVDNRLSSGAFKEDDLELLTSICNLAAMAIENAKLFQNIQIETRRRTDFERFLSPSVVEQVMRGEVKLAESGEGIATILFSDIRSFTTLSESMEPAELVAQLNEYFSEMTNCI